MTSVMQFQGKSGRWRSGQEQFRRALACSAAAARQRLLRLADDRGQPRRAPAADYVPP